MEYEYLRRYREVLNAVKAMPTTVAFNIPDDVQELFREKPRAIPEFYDAILSKLRQEPYAVDFYTYAQNNFGTAGEQWLAETTMKQEYDRISALVVDQLHGYFPYGRATAASPKAYALMKFSGMELVEYVTRKRPDNEL
jgi:hypothetical protein